MLLLYVYRGRYRKSVKASPGSNSTVRIFRSIKWVRCLPKAPVVQKQLHLILVADGVRHAIVLITSMTEVVAHLLFLGRHQ